MWKKNNNSKTNSAMDLGPNVPAFLVKLWKLVEDPECDLIYWSESGMSFIINAQARFAREVLPLHYKHNNMASFIRQLNMYGFHKINHSDYGGLRHDRDEMEFAHQYFVRDHPYLLENIKRKLSNPKSTSSENVSSNGTRNGAQSDLFSKLLSDVNILKGKQESWDARLSAMKRENEALWRELAVFRQKHLKQEQIINRLIHFIVTIVQPSRKVPIPRRFPLMLNDTHEVRNFSNLNGSSGSQSNRSSPPGPTIHEIDGDVLIGGNTEVRESSKLRNGDLNSKSFSNSTSNLRRPEPKSTKDPVMSSPDPLSKKENPSDWLEIVLTEDDTVTPLTPVDPTKVNPVVAAATLKHLENNNHNKVTIPVTMNIPSIVTSDGKKKTIPEKKIIYLAEIPNPDKSTKKKQVKPPNPRNETNKSKGPVRQKANATATESGGKNLKRAGDENKSSPRILTTQTKTTASGKRKLPASNSASTSRSPNKRQRVELKPKVEAATEHSSPFPTPNTLENLLKYNMFDLEALENEENIPKKEPPPEDSFWKLESLYNGSIAINELITDEGEEETNIEQNIKTPKDRLIAGGDEKKVEVSLSDASTTEIELPKLTEKDEGENSNPAADFPSESLAVVRQPSSSNASDELSRELSSHVDNVQGEIDYLKEVLKGEGYNLDMNNILGYFNDDPLAYGLLPPTEEEPKQKESDKAVAGNEIITYGGTPTNLMELVDLFGSPGTVQDWSNIVSPTSPTVSELTTPISSPSPAGAAKRRKT